MLFGAADIRMRRLFIDQEETADEHKRRAHARLGTLVGYCEASACRRQILLGYFGEDAQPCGNCDNCQEAVPQADATREALLVFDVVAQTGARFGAAHIVEILRGAKTQKLADRGHDRLACFGSGAAWRKEEWQSLIRQLAAGGYLLADDHGGLSLSSKGEALHRGEMVFAWRPVTPRTKARAETSAQTGDPALLAALKALRLKLARERQVPAYVIFSDRTLLDMAERHPRDMDDFAQVHGVGAAKLKEFGKIFLGVLTQAQG
jgi:ATP-dependent DNA helicase RecQ